ncbi:hypothetical protein ACOME3_004962 [Neoechinorhynchus agilis]
MKLIAMSDSERSPYPALSPSVCSDFDLASGAVDPEDDDTAAFSGESFISKVDILNRSDSRCTNNQKHQRSFSRELEQLLYGCGDVEKPLDETVEALEKIVVDYISTMACRAASVRQGPNIQPEDFYFLLRDDPRKLLRATQLLRMDKELKRARKVFEDEKFD